MKDIQSEFKEFCKKIGVENVIIGYADENGSVSTLASGESSKQYEISAVLFGFYKSNFNTHIVNLVSEGDKK